MVFELVLGGWLVGGWFRNALLSRCFLPALRKIPREREREGGERERERDAIRTDINPPVYRASENKKLCSLYHPHTQHIRVAVVSHCPMGGTWSCKLKTLCHQSQVGNVHYGHRNVTSHTPVNVLKPPSLLSALHVWEVAIIIFYFKIRQ